MGAPALLWALYAGSQFLEAKKAKQDAVDAQKFKDTQSSTIDYIGVAQGEQNERLLLPTELDGSTITAKRIGGTEASWEKVDPTTTSENLFMMGIKNNFTTGTEAQLSQQFGKEWNKKAYTNIGQRLSTAGKSEDDISDKIISSWMDSQKTGDKSVFVFEGTKEENGKIVKVYGTSKAEVENKGASNIGQVEVPQQFALGLGLSEESLQSTSKKTFVTPTAPETQSYFVGYVNGNETQFNTLEEAEAAGAEKVGQAVYKSSDGGNTWTRKGNIVFLPTTSAADKAETQNFFVGYVNGNEIRYETEGQAIAAGASRVGQASYETVDGGTNWTRKGAITFLPTPDVEIENRSYFVGNVGGNERRFNTKGEAESAGAKDIGQADYESEDGGTTWRRVGNISFLSESDEGVVEKSYFVGYVNNNEKRFETRAEAEVAGAVNIGQAIFKSTDDGKTWERKGKITFIPAPKPDKVAPKHYVDAVRLDTEGKPVTGTVEQIPLAQFNANRSEYDPQLRPNGEPVAYQLNEDGSRKSISIGISETSKALKIADALVKINYTDADQKQQTFFVENNSTNAKPENRLVLYRQFLASLPQLPNYEYDISSLEPSQLRSFIAQIALDLQDSLTITDPKTKERIPVEDVVADMAQFVNNKLPILRSLRGDPTGNNRWISLERQLQELASLEAAQIKEVAQQAASNTTLPDGDSAGAIVSMVNGEVPAEATAGGSVISTEPVRVKVPIISIFNDTRYGGTVKNAISMIAHTMLPEGVTEATESLESKNDRINKATTLVSTLIEYKKDESGAIVRGPNGREILSDTQVKLDFVKSLNNTTGGIPDMATFMNMLKLGSERKIGNQSVERSISTAFKELVDSDYASAVQVVQTFSPSATGTKRDALLFARVTGKSSGLFQKHQQAELTRADGAATANKQIGSMIGTYYLDGEPMNINSFWGNLYVQANGFVNMVADQSPFLAEMVGSLLPEDATSQLEVSLYGKATDTGERRFISISQQIPSNVDELAAEKGMSKDEYLQAEAKARKENREQFREVTKGINSNDAKVKNLALRNYYRYMVAYTMAAAIQGGTGGRTISDQDVQNILRALNVTGPWIEAKVEVEVLKAAQDMLTEMEAHSRMVASTDPSQSYAALKVQEIARGGRKSRYTADDVADRLQTAMKEAEGADETGAGQPALDDADTQKVTKVNEQFRSFNVTAELEKKLAEDGYGENDTIPLQWFIDNGVYSETQIRGMVKN